MNIIKPEKEVLTVWRIYIMIASVVPAVLIFLFTKGNIQNIALVAWLVAFLFIFVVYLPLYYNSVYYIIDDKVIAVKKGVVYKRYYNILTDKVQFSAIIFLPFTSRFGLVILQIVATGAKIYLPGLTLREARSIEKIIVQYRKDENSAE